MSSLPLLSFQNVSFAFHDTDLLKEIELHVYPGDRLCLIGSNGSGKSTLMKLIDETLFPHGGTIFRMPKLRLGVMPQSMPVVSAETTALDFVLSGLVQTDDAAEMRYKAEWMLETFGLPTDRLLNSMSGGEQRRAALARLFAAEHDIVLLDEPTNHLDIASIEHLESFLKTRSEAMIIVSHDRAFLESVSRRTFWLLKGRLNSFNRGFANFDQWSETFLEAEAKRLEKINTHLSQELHWLQRGVTARRKRNQGRLQKLEALRTLKRETQSNVNKQKKKMKLSAQEEEFAGRELVVETENVSYSIGGRTLVKNCTVRVVKGERIGILGPNGCGKTTLLNLLLGDLKPSNGTVSIPVAIDPLVFRQDQSHLNLQETPWQFLAPYGQDFVQVLDTRRHVVAYLKDFLFDENQARLPISNLSGGERNRLMLAKILAQPSELLVLDEPTNDLDQETLDILQDWLAEYKGTVLLVSHNRHFLDNVVTSLLVFEGDGVVQEHVGGFSDWQRNHQKKRTAAVPATSKTAVTVPVSKRPQNPSKRLSYMQERRLAMLPAEVDDLARKATDLEKRLEDPALWDAPQSVFIELTKELASTKKALADAENLFFELQTAKEEAGG